MPPTDPTGPWPEQQVLLTRLAAWMSERRWFPLKDEQPPDGAALRVVADSRPASGVRDLVVAVPRTSSRSSWAPARSGPAAPASQDSAPWPRSRGR